jgi:valyl-tRNA synthetase
MRFILRANDKTIATEIPTVTRLMTAEELVVDPRYQPPPGTPVAITPLGEIFLPVAVVDRERERERLDREIVKVESELRAVETKMDNPSFVDRAPAPVVEQHRQRLSALTAELAKLKQAREALT